MARSYHATAMPGTPALSDLHESKTGVNGLFYPDAGLC